MADHHVVHHVVVMSASFIVHGPTGVDKLEAALLYELAHIILLLLSLRSPPHGEELHLHLGEALFLVFHELKDIRVNDVLHFRMLDTLGRACEVLVDSLEPADIVVAVGDNVHE